MNLRPVKGRALRNDYGVVGYVGANGGGKTLSAIWDSMPTLDSGRPVLSTVRILDWRDPRPCDGTRSDGSPCSLLRPAWATSGRVLHHEVGDEVDHSELPEHPAEHPLFVPFTDWTQLMDWAFGDVIMDEVSGVASSRESHSMPGEVGTHLQQLRKGDTVVRWTAPSWKRADTVIREVSQIVVSCRGFVPKEHVAAEGEIQRRWKQRRLFVWQTFDAYAFEDFTVGAREKLKPLGRDFHWGPGSPVFSAYDTYQKALSIGTANVHGRCMTCGGRRSAPPCRCDR